MKVINKIQITRFVVGSIATNMYLVQNGPDGLIIDPGFELKEKNQLISEIERKCSKIMAILLTHGHYDHISGLPYLREDFDCHIYCHKDDTDMLLDPTISGTALFSIKAPSAVKADKNLYNEQVLQLIGKDFRILHTPGHTKGSISIVLDNFLFSGDTLFRDGIGRTDFFGGDYETEISSITQKILILPPHTEILPGHGPATTVAREAKYF